MLAVYESTRHCCCAVVADDKTRSVKTKTEPRRRTDSPKQHETHSLRVRSGKKKKGRTNLPHTVLLPSPSGNGQSGKGHRTRAPPATLSSSPRSDGKQLVALSDEPLAPAGGLAGGLLVAGGRGLGLGVPVEGPDKLRVHRVDPAAFGGGALTELGGAQLADGGLVETPAAEPPVLELADELEGAADVVCPELAAVGLAPLSVTRAAADTVEELVDVVCGPVKVATVPAARRVGEVHHVEEIVGGDDRVDLGGPCRHRAGEVETEHRRHAVHLREQHARGIVEEHLWLRRNADDLRRVSCDAGLVARAGNLACLAVVEPLSAEGVHQRRLADVGHAGDHQSQPQWWRR